jgi:hypothetical protein
MQLILLFGIVRCYSSIEVKGPKGKQSEYQKKFQRRLEDAGGKYILAHSLEDAIWGANK